MKRPVSLLSFQLTSAALALSLLAGCGEKEDPIKQCNAGTGPLYAVTTQLLTTDTPQSYVILTDKAEQAGTLSLDNATEVPGRALGVGIPKSGSLYVVSDENATVTRYTLTSGGCLEESGTVSFSGKGISSLGEYQNNFQFVSATKAYYFDGTTAQVVIWNPTEMKVTGSIALDELTIPGTTMAFSGAPLVLDNQIIMPVGWRPTSGVGITKKAAVVTIDTRTDEAFITTDNRCGYTHDAAVGPDGKVYIATEVYGAAVYRVAGGDTPVPCLLKFDPQSHTFDASFYKELSALVGGGTAGALIPGPQGTAYVRVLDESIAPVSEGTHPRIVASGTGWQWWQLKLDTLAATRMTDFPSTTGSVFLYESENQTLYTEFAAGAASTTLHVLGESGKATVSTQGLSFSFLQLR
ncbi:MxcI protein [Vitiosangium sp. GDMCC 1.1324]|uniref:MxcI protein n=1 Tax=Vitiosangium sp. (strain GDMCC 1.1324) TaxID=2138576 RepID=UPI000D3D78BE|nr:MxcI protein [Vitiosangium sp. GDMCC 1.1324]PTL75966.1 MxcI protein [Vitiosangium sp. GDMCC 1.1324]